uniref:Uncharacterized protein n=1 Tax=Lepeophtheirus salmonis TaxID=72036 RepID=A0A0K2TPP6_LEPSM
MQIRRYLANIKICNASCQYVCSYSQLISGLNNVDWLNHKEFLLRFPTKIIKEGIVEIGKELGI